MIVGMIPKRPIKRISRRGLLGLSVGAALTGLSGCGSGEPTYYTLTPSPGTPQGGGPATVEVRTPSIASYLDRDSIVRNDTNHQLTLAPGNAWASPLSGMIGRNLALDLAQRLPGSNVTTQDDAISAEPGVLIELDVSSFLENAAGLAELSATLSVYRRGSSSAESQTLHLTEAPADRSINTMVAALSVLLGQVADRAAASCRALPPRGD